MMKELAIKTLGGYADVHIYDEEKRMIGHGVAVTSDTAFVYSFEKNKLSLVKYQGDKEIEIVSDINSEMLEAFSTLIENMKDNNEKSR